MYKMRARARRCAALTMPHTSMPLARPIVLMIGTAIELPRHQMAPPSIATGSNLGQAPCCEHCTMKLIRPAVKMAVHMMNWKNMPASGEEARAR